ncbi:MAG: hypothetical protein RRB13_13690 [bacterium]|nr:hypothetical protein [bacterium]
MIRRSLLVLVLLFWTLGTLFAETIYLKNGQTLVGKILKYNPQSITVQAIGDQQEREIRKDDIYLINFDSNSEQRYIEFKKQMAANVVYLKNGEVIIGRITNYNPEFITIESLRGQGVLQMPTSEVNMITTQDTVVNMNQRTGVGYVQKKSTLNSNSGPATYTSDQLSYKFFLDERLFGNILIAFGSSVSNGNALKVFAADYRMGYIFDRYRNVNLYYGGSGGLLQVTDDANGVSGSGISLSGFLGAEIFFASLPNFGFSGEIGAGYRKAGEYTSTDLSASAFPTFSVHYYF